MRKQVMVIGGSYFAGRVFSILSSRGEDFHLHVVNRGRFPLNLPNITEYKCDRHDEETLKNLFPEDLVFDAVVDYCAYEPLDISTIFDMLPGKFKQYIVFSTASVYDQTQSRPKTEEDGYSTNFPDDAVGQYMFKKCLLEIELEQEAEKAGIPFTILRPTYIYGPYNYAPRESYYVQRIMQGLAVPVPKDSKSTFNFVYVTDTADAARLCIGDERAYNMVFNLACGENISYEDYMKELVVCNGKPFLTREVTVEDVIAQNIPLPFPLDNDELYSGELFAKTFDYKYTPFEVGMPKAFNAFKSIYGPRE